MCEECYVDEYRKTPLLKPYECLKNHIQYVCGTCGRCICIERDKKRGLQRWNFPFKTLEEAKLYLRSADFTMKQSCGIYKIKADNGRESYKIFATQQDLESYLRKNSNKQCENINPIFIVREYKEYKNTKICRLSEKEIEIYLSER